MQCKTNDLSKSESCYINKFINLLNVTEKRTTYKLVTSIMKETLTPYFIVKYFLLSKDYIFFLIMWQFLNN
jgi:hypothetical protein